MLPYAIGDIVKVFDKIDPINQPPVIATVRFIEQDNEINDLYWMYLLSIDDMLNDKIDPMIGPYFTIVESTNEYVQKI